jgi:hypothetical protein
VSITEYSIALHKRRAKMEEDIFEHPPQTWDEFQKRLGAHIELTISINDMDALIKGVEDNK